MRQRARRAHSTPQYGRGAIVVIRHEGELMTVLAGMSQLSVQKGDQVKAGQKIGTAGSSRSAIFISRSAKALMP